jgi:hypothetical protein
MPYVKTVRTKTHKLSLCGKGNRSWGQLYDLVDDPGETRNRYDDPAFAWAQRALERRLLNGFIETQQPVRNHRLQRPYPSSPQSPGGSSVSAL